MGWLQIILLVLKYGPLVINLIGEIIELIRKIRNSRHKKNQVAAIAYEARLKGACKHYKETRDRRPLYKLRDELRAELGYNKPI